jgi:hypothetical protein
MGLATGGSLSSSVTSGSEASRSAFVAGGEGQLPHEPQLPAEVFFGRISRLTSRATQPAAAATQINTIANCQF